MLVEVKYKLTIKLPRERLINYHEIEYERNRYLEEMARKLNQRYYEIICLEGQINKTYLLSD